MSYGRLSRLLISFQVFVKYLHIMSSTVVILFYVGLLYQHCLLLLSYLVS